MREEVKVLDHNDCHNKVAIVIGTRPGIIMFAPIIKELRATSTPHFIIHTGQHYSPNMDECLFKDLALPAPDYRLETVSQYKTHGTQTAEMLRGIEEILFKEKPKIVLVGGDANTNLAGALAARKLGIKVGHIEAGERSFDWSMPEEHNRRMIDHISDYLFVTGEKAKKQLEKESVRGQIFVTGNPIVDASLQHADMAKARSEILKKLNLSPQGYILLTTHREENVDSKDKLKNILEGAARASEKLNLPVIFPAHPRTQKRLKEFELENFLKNLNQIMTIDAVSYFDFTVLLINSALVLTDSGGVQQEACIHQIPAVTVRLNTEWVETLESGANVLAGTDPALISTLAYKSTSKKRSWPVPFGDGFSSVAIIEIVKNALEQEELTYEHA